MGDRRWETGWGDDIWPAKSFSSFQVSKSTAATLSPLSHPGCLGEHPAAMPLGWGENDQAQLHMLLVPSCLCSLQLLVQEPGWPFPLKQQPALGLRFLLREGGLWHLSVFVRYTAWIKRWEALLWNNRIMPAAFGLKLRDWGAFTEMQSVPANT